MPTLHLQQTELGPGRYRITVSSDLFTLQHTRDFDFQLAPADQEAIRWYLEDYLDKPFEPNPSIAARGRTGTCPSARWPANWCAGSTKMPAVRWSWTCCARPPSNS